MLLTVSIACDQASLSAKLTIDNDQLPADRTMAFGPEGISADAWRVWVLPFQMKLQIGVFDA